MNRQAQTGVLTYFTSVLVFVIIWALWLGRHFSEWGANAVANNSLTGIEAFLFMNINLVIFFALLIASSAVYTVNAVQ